MSAVLQKHQHSLLQFELSMCDFIPRIWDNALLIYRTSSACAVVILSITCIHDMYKI